MLYRHIKRVLSLLLITALIMTMLPLSALAVDGDMTDLNNGFINSSDDDSITGSGITDTDSDDESDSDDGDDSDDSGNLNVTLNPDGLNLQITPFAAVPTINGSTDQATKLSADIRAYDATDLYPCDWVVTMTTLPGVQLVADEAELSSDYTIVKAFDSSVGGGADDTAAIYISGSDPNNPPTNIDGIYFNVPGALLQTIPMWSDTTEVGLLNIFNLPKALDGTFEAPVDIKYNLVSPSSPGTPAFVNEHNSPPGAGRGFIRIDTFTSSGAAYEINSVSFNYAGIPAKSDFGNRGGQLPSTKTSGVYTAARGTPFDTSEIVYFRGTGGVQTVYGTGGWKLEAFNAASLTKWSSTRQLAGTDLTEVCVFLYNPKDTVVTNAALSVSADVQIGSDDYASIHPIKDEFNNYYGFTMTSNTGVTLALINANEDKYGVGETAPNWWGHYSKTSANVNNDQFRTTPYTTTSDNETSRPGDSGAAAKVRKIRVDPGMMQVYTFYIGTGTYDEIMDAVGAALESSQRSDYSIISVQSPTNAVLAGRNIMATVTGSEQLIDVTVSPNASWDIFSDPQCTSKDNIRTDAVTLKPTMESLVIGVNTAYIKVTAEDGVRNKIYTVNITRAAPAFSDECELLDVTQPPLVLTDIYENSLTYPIVRTSVLTTDSAVTFKKPLSAGDPTSFKVSPLATWEIYSDETCTIPINSMDFPENREYAAYIKVTAEDNTTHKVYKLVVSKPASDKCDIIDVLDPVDPINDVLDRQGQKITYTAPYRTNAQTIDVTVSPGATWEMFSDSNCTPGNEITVINLPLIGENKAYIKVLAENGTANKIYVVVIIRRQSDECDILDVAQPLDLTYITQSAPWRVRSSVPMHTNIADITLTVSDGAKWDLFTDPQCTLPLDKNQLVFNISSEHLYTVYAEVTAADDQTKKVYELVVARPPSDQCDILSVIEPLGTLLNQAEQTISAQFDNSAAQIALDFEVSDGATWQLLGGLNAAGLDLSVGENIVYIRVTAEDGIAAKVYTMKIIRDAAPIIAPAPAAPAAPPTDIDNTTNVFVDGYPAPRGDIVDIDGALSVVVGHDELKEQLETAYDSVTIIAPSYSNAAGAKFDLRTVEEMAGRDMIISVQTGEIRYDLPAAAVDISAALDALNAADSAEVTLSIFIRTDIDASSQAEAYYAANELGGQLLGSPVEFIVTADYLGQTYEFEFFDRFVSRAIRIGTERPEQRTTAIAAAPDGTFHHAPAYVYQSDGVWYAMISSLTNSIYALVENDKAFSDVRYTDFEDAVNELGSRGIVYGIGGGLFSGERDVTRAEFTVILVRALGLPVYNQGWAFDDAAGSEWFSGSLDAAYLYGVVYGTGDGNFLPNERITRQEAMIMIHRAALLAGFPDGAADIDSYADAEDVSAWALEAVMFNAGYGLIDTTGDLLRPLDYMTRAEAASIVLRLLQKSILVDVRSTLREIPAALPFDPSVDIPARQPRTKPDPAYLPDEDERIPAIAGGGDDPPDGDDDDDGGVSYSGTGSDPYGVAYNDSFTESFENDHISDDKDGQVSSKADLRNAINMLDDLLALTRMPK